MQKIRHQFWRWTSSLPWLIIMTSLTNSELGIIYETIRRAEDIRETGVTELSDLFTVNPRLIISPSDKCSCSCLHCVADSKPSGMTMPYSDFVGIAPEFIKIFSVADFGRKGNPLLYYSDGHDIIDLMEFLNENGISTFTLALALQKYPVPQIDRLEEFVKNKKADISTMVTYHHYYDNLDTTKLAEDFNCTLKNYFRFSKEILISLLGDQYSQIEPTKAYEVQKIFQDNWEIIFDGIKIASTGYQTYRAKYKNEEAEVKIPSLDHRVYPLGRFRQYLAQRGVLQEYETQFEQTMSDYVCPDLIKWPGVIIEPDGSLNLCASFEAVTCQGAVISNIFTKSYPQVKKDLTQFHGKELRWFIDNLTDIISGKVSTCKLKNNCYQ